jgi:hypothetical protein
MKKINLFLFILLFLKHTYSTAQCSSYFTWSYDPFLLSSLFLTDSSTGTTGPVTYQWDFGDGSQIDTTQNPIHWLIGQTQTICLTITDSIGCTSTYCDSLLNIFDFSSEINDNSIRIKFFPNPAIESCTIYFGDNYQKNISVFDILGKELFKTNTSTESFLLHTEKFINGIYFVKIKEDENQIRTYRLIIAHK